MSPVIAVHLTAALAAAALGPLALYARLGRVQRPRLHRAMGYAWVTLMVLAAASALWIRDYQLPNLAGFTPIHLLVPLTAYGLTRAFVALARKDYAAHRRFMQALYRDTCVIAGLFTLLPSRYLGQLVWGQWLGWL